MSNFAIALSGTSSPQQVASSENTDRVVHVHVIGSTASYVGIGFTSNQVSTADKGLLLYGGANAGGPASTATFALPSGEELWIGPSVGVLSSFLITED